MNNTAATATNLGALIPIGYQYTGLQRLSFLEYDSAGGSDRYDYFKFVTPAGVTQIKVSIDAYGLFGDQSTNYKATFVSGLENKFSGEDQGWEATGLYAQNITFLTPSGVSGIYNVTPGEHILKVDVLSSQRNAPDPQINYSLNITPQTYATQQPSGGGVPPGPNSGQSGAPGATVIPAAPSNGMTSTGSPFFQLNSGGLQTVFKPTAYSGPVAGIDWQYLGSAAATETISGTFQADFINGLGGTDVIFGNAGNDVLDGGTGSNYLVGGEGTDIFFTDARGGQAGWTTIADFMPGIEQVSIFGFRPGVTRVFWEEGYGAEGSKGATAFFDIDGSSQTDRSGVDFAVTFSGRTASEIGSRFELDGLLWFRPTI